ncbi:hypothetical protein NXT08_16545 [Rhodococcus pyridinivorans]|uniref:LppU family putative lipoprotein n=1 Tax=Rhodococcus pyridinivorans TaxID=103816 RepID=UPI001FFFEABF|nr:hypothetical protein [Rhodococcus pyridinivorans]UPK66028.1 hypothetical protein MYP14_12295 [Rhodococcus pyridinivorans]UVT23902.1 hypothetical protein NXT08_16545 [Rhodococcus pyridinivorans]
MNILRGAAGAAMALAAAGVLGGCATQVEGQAVPAANALDTSTAPSFSLPTTTPSASSSTELSVDVAVGECVALGGTVDDATIDYAVCGSPSSNYKVVDVVDASAMCPGDIDQTYYESFGGIEVGALCLDIDWVVGDCIDLGGEDPQRIDCGEPAVQGEEVTEILLDTSDVNDCSTSEGGFVYRERNFVVCTDTI